MGRASRCASTSVLIRRRTSAPRIDGPAHLFGRGSRTFEKLEQLQGAHAKQPREWVFGFAPEQRTIEARALRRSGVTLIWEWRSDASDYVPHTASQTPRALQLRPLAHAEESEQTVAQRALILLQPLPAGPQLAQ
jgi:hypothetical protein